MYASEDFRKATLKTLKSIISNRKYKIERKLLVGDGKSYKYGSEYAVFGDNKEEIFQVRRTDSEYKTGGEKRELTQYNIVIGGRSFFGKFADTELKDLIESISEEIIARKREEEINKAEKEKESEEGYVANFLSQYIK